MYIEDPEDKKEIDLLDNTLMAAWILEQLEQMDQDLRQAGLENPDRD